MPTRYDEELMKELLKDCKVTPERLNEDFAIIQAITTRLHEQAERELSGQHASICISCMMSLFASTMRMLKIDNDRFDDILASMKQQYVNIAEQERDHDDRNDPSTEDHTPPMQPQRDH